MKYEMMRIGCRVLHLVLSLKGEIMLLSCHIDFGKAFEVVSHNTQ